MSDMLCFPKRVRTTSVNSKLPQATFSLPHTWYVFLSILLRAFFACIIAAVRPARGIKLSSFHTVWFLSVLP